MDSKIRQTEVQSFSSWNTKLNQLLNEADEQSDKVAPDVKDTDPNVDEFKSMATNVGSDIYSLTLFDYENDFADADANQTLVDMLNKINNPVVSEFVANNNMIDSNDKTVAVLFYNDKTQEFFTFSAGEKFSDFNASLAELTGKKIIESDQIAVIKKIKAAGEKYKSAVSNNTWKAGEPPLSSSISDALSDLLVVVRATDMPKIKRAPMPWEMSPEELARAKEVSAGMNNVDTSSKEYLDVLKYFQEKEKNMVLVVKRDY